MTSLTVYTDGSDAPVTGDGLNTFQQTCDNVAQLRAFIGVAGVQVYVRGTTSVADGGQGEFYWNATGTAPDDNGVTTVVPNGSGTGEWTRLPFTSVGSFAVSGNMTVTGTETVGGTLAVAGAATVPTPAAGDNSTRAATTAFVRAQMIPAVQVYTSGSGTYTTPAGAYYLRIRMIGGGGGGGGGGVGGGTGGTGGTTSFGAVTANGGGGGGSGGGSGGSGGSGSATLRLAGGSGSVNTSGLSGQYAASGAGASSPFGGSGGATPDGNAGANASSNTGSGASGGTATIPGNVVGAGGGAGEYVENVIVAPSVTYSYTVGIGGAAGAAGTSGNIGGVGGSGLILIEAY